MSDDLTLDTKAEVSSPEKQVRRWLLEIKLAEKREKDWRKTAQSIWNIYRGVKRKRNSFNILWSNTEVLRPSLYNSIPKPDVRRRFRQKDLLGKAVAEVMERSITYCADAYDIDHCLQNDVLDGLLPGRGLSRVRYIPKFSDSVDSENAPEDVDYEQALCEHVQWDDFLHGPGKEWEEVQWEGFRHRLSKDDLIEKFGEEIAKEISLDDVDDSDVNDNKSHEDLKEVFKRAELWEIWDREEKKVFFVNESYKKGLLYPKDSKDGTPPLELKNFFPNPRPLRLVEDSGTLIPEPLYELYREQAEELDRISMRINKIINACRVRFVHDPTLTELKELMGAGDNEGIPAESARSYMTMGGLDKAIWFMPVDKIVQVLKELYIARDGCKQVIYELTGISDIIRGQTDPNETLGAQQLKMKSSSLRMQRMQTEVQRYARDLIRLLGEVIGENFSYQTLEKMTGLQFPTDQQKKMIGLQMQAMQQQMQQPQAQGQPQMQPPPQLAAMHNAMQIPSWEDILKVTKSDMARGYRVDIETDSTVAQQLSQDMEGMKEVLTGLVEFWQGVGPAVQSGALSVEAVKSISLTIVRRARMGLEVEDALEAGMHEPKPQADPKAAAEAAKQQQEAQQAQHDRMLSQRQQAHEEQIAQREQAVEAAKVQAESAAEERRMAMEAHFEQQRMAMEQSAKEKQSLMDASFDRFKALLDSITKIEVAEIAADATISSAQESAAKASVQ